MSSKYPSTDFHFYVASMMSSASCNDSGALKCPKDILLNWYSSSYESNASFPRPSPFTCWIKFPKKYVQQDYWLPVLDDSKNMLSKCAFHVDTNKATREVKFWDNAGIFPRTQSARLFRAYVYFKTLSWLKMPSYRRKELVIVISHVISQIVNQPVSFWSYDSGCFSTTSRKK